MPRSPWPPCARLRRQARRPGCRARRNPRRRSNMLTRRKRERRRLAVAIDRPAAEAYDFLSAPENIPKWASGLAASLRKVGDEWVADTPGGTALVRFSERNAYGVLDHSVTLPQGLTVYVPLRVVARESGCELVLTLFRQQGMSEE